MTLEHELRSPCSGVPELYAPILGSGQDPVRVGGQSDGEDKVPVTFERPDALATPATTTASGGAKLPHLDGSVQTTAHQLLASWRESN